MCGPGFQTIRLTLSGRPTRRSELADFVGVGELVVDAAEQDVFEGELLFGTERNLADGVDEVLDVPFAGDGHDLFAHLVVGRVEGDGELRTDGFLSEAQDAGHDAGGGDGHARFGDADFVDERRTASMKAS